MATTLPTVLAASTADFSFSHLSTASNSSSSNVTIDHDEGEEEEDDWLSPLRLLGLLTTVLVPLVFGVIVVVGELLFALFKVCAKNPMRRSVGWLSSSRILFFWPSSLVSALRMHAPHIEELTIPYSPQSSQESPQKRTGVELILLYRTKTV